MLDSVSEHDSSDSTVSVDSDLDSHFSSCFWYKGVGLRGVGVRLFVKERGGLVRLSVVVGGIGWCEEDGGVINQTRWGEMVVGKRVSER